MQRAAGYFSAASADFCTLTTDSTKAVAARLRNNGKLMYQKVRAGFKPLRKLRNTARFSAFQNARRVD
jgi:hypothetical protein